PPRAIHESSPAVPGMRQRPAAHPGATRRCVALGYPGLSRPDLHHDRDPHSMEPGATENRGQPRGGASALAADARPLAHLRMMSPAMKLANMEPVLTRIAAWDYSQARDPLYESSSFLRSNAAAQSDLPQFEARLMGMLSPKTVITLKGRDYACRELSVIVT